MSAPLTDILPAYLYQQYSDDSDLAAFVTQHNAIAQGYLDWFNASPLSVYTSPNISSNLLDWIGTGIYGIARPVYVTSSFDSYGQLGTDILGLLEVNGFRTDQGSTSYSLGDDFYKRLLTWILYRGDGQQPSIPWLRRRVARMVYGADGSDIGVDSLLNVSISASSGTLTISLPTSNDSQIFEVLMAAGSLPLPFQAQYTVTLT